MLHTLRALHTIYLILSSLSYLILSFYLHIFLCFETVLDEAHATPDACRVLHWPTVLGNSQQLPGTADAFAALSEISLHQCIFSRDPIFHRKIMENPWIAGLNNPLIDIRVPEFDWFFQQTKVRTSSWLMMLRWSRGLKHKEDSTFWRTGISPWATSRENWPNWKRLPPWSGEGRGCLSLP